MSRLRRDRRGSAVIAPIFIVLVVITLATVVSALLFAGQVSERVSAQNASGAVTRSAVAAMAAELNTKPLAQITTGLSGAGGYVPAAWIPSPGQAVRVTAVTGLTPDVIQVTFAAATDRTQEITFTVEYRHLPVVLRDGEWEDAAGSDIPDRSVWTPVRTILEAS